MTLSSTFNLLNSFRPWTSDEGLHSVRRNLLREKTPTENLDSRASRRHRADELKKSFVEFISKVNSQVTRAVIYGLSTSQVIFTGSMSRPAIFDHRFNNNPHRTPALTPSAKSHASGLTNADHWGGWLTLYIYVICDFSSKIGICPIFATRCEYKNSLRTPEYFSEWDSS